MKLLQKLKNLAGRLDARLSADLGSTEQGVYWLSMAALSLAGAAGALHTGLHPALAFPLGLLLSFLAANLALVLGCLLLKLLLRTGPVALLCTAACAALLAVWLYTSCRGNIPFWGALLAALVPVCIFRVLAQTLWAIVKNRSRRPWVLATAAVSGILAVWLLVFVLDSGFDDSYVEDYLLLAEEDGEDARLRLSAPVWPVEVLYYGDAPEASLSSDTVNLGPYVGGYRGLQKWYRERYQGYDIWNVPLTGKVWYPEGGKDCPILFLVHGNHNLTTDSYEGYDYLGKYLAARGYVVVSVDENACNWCIFGNLRGENDGRAYLLLENVRQVLSYSRDRDNPLFGMVDETRIALAGHSRGGEAAATAARFCTLDRYPSNGNIRFHWNFGIRSIIAIAPTSDQYQPAGHDVLLEDVNYLLLQGANDQDVSVFMGARQYENVCFSGRGDWCKSSLYIAGANHGQFNTLWGRFDLAGPAAKLLNVENLLSAREQQEILCIFSAAFLDVTLKGERSCEGLLHDCSEYADYLPRTVYIQSYEDSGFRLLADFEENADLAWEQDGEVRVKVSGAEQWQENAAPYANPAMDDGEGRGTHVLNLSWGENMEASLELRFDAMDAAGLWLQFDIADGDTQAVAEEDYALLDCAVILADSHGQSCSVRLRDWCEVYPPLPVKLGKLQYLLGDEEYKLAYQTCRIPVSAFAESGELDVTSLIRVKLVFDEPGGGRVHLDNLGFSAP